MLAAMSRPVDVEVRVRILAAWEWFFIDLLCLKS
jgi:hypothetical protein